MDEYKGSEYDSDASGAVDRLSSLPDSLIVEILSLLPIEYAVATSVLSRRWSHLWTGVNRLSFNQFFFQSPRISEYLDTVDHIIRQLTSPKILNFELVLYYYEYNYDEDDQHLSALLGSWLREICGRNVEEIKVQCGNLTSAVISLPDCVFECRSLVSLCLYCFYRIKLPHCRIVNLPNLKKLHLRFLEWNGELMSTLFKSCPMLEELDLCVVSVAEDPLLDISSRSLRRLRLTLARLSQGQVSIDASNLEHLSICSCSYWFYRFVKKPSGLLEADIRLLDEYDEDENKYLCQKLEVVCKISGVRCLHLHHSLLNSLKHLNYDVLPVFHYLKDLSTTMGSFSWNGLLLFLQRAPNLEVLIVSMNYHEGDPPEDKIWHAPESTPAACLISELKRVEITRTTGVRHEWDFLEYILRSAHVLEKLVCGYEDYDNNGKEHELCMNLFCFPRSSSSCEIEFSSKNLTASSTGFKDELLDGQIRGF